MPRLDRRFALLGMAACASTAVFPLQGQAQSHSPGFGFAFSTSNTRFGIVITPHSAQANLVTVRTFDNALRVAFLVPRTGVQARSATIEGSGRRATLAIEGDELILRGRGLTFLGVSQLPAQGGGQPQTQGLFRTILRNIGDTLGEIGDVLHGIGVGIAAGLSWLIGAEFQMEFANGHGGIIVGSDGSILVGYGTANVVPPPPGTEGNSNVWY